jgi:preprotein translocase subunit SecB
MKPVQPAPVQLFSYTAETIQFDVNPVYVEEEPDLPNTEELSEERFDFIPEVISIPTQEEQGTLRLTVGMNRDDEEWSSYYRLSITITGRFEWVDPDPSIPDDEFRKYYMQSGLSLLYGIIREKVIQLSSSSPYPRMMIPTITFKGMVEEMASQYSEEGQNEKNGAEE